MPNRVKQFFNRLQPRVNITRDFYTMATVDGDEAEIVMYGEIVQEQPKDWWTNEPIEGNYIVLDEFLEDLKQIANVSNITIRMNSVGGDAYAAIPIHNRLRELKAHKVCIVDGVAMSGGSLIMCAADVVKVNASSLIMAHLCWSAPWGAYNANELRKLASSMDSVDKAQAAIYKRKTGMSEEDLLAMMAEEIYMTGSEAIEKGFADELVEGDAPEIAASADLSTLFVNGRALKLGHPLVNLPDSIPTVKSDEPSVTSVKTNKVESDEGGKIMAKNLEELKAENPDLAAKVMEEARASAAAEKSTAVENERKRIAEIDEIATLYSDELVREAKYGENPCTAQELAFRSAKEAAQKGSQFVADLDDDSKSSKANDVKATPAPDDNSKPLTAEELMAQGRAQARKMQQKEEE